MTINANTATELTPLLLETEAGVISGLQRINTSPEEDTNDPLIVVLHAAGGGARSLARMAQQLQIKGQLVIPDLTGYGQTRLIHETANELSAVEQHLLVIGTLINQLRRPQQDVVLVGQSMGGFLCLKTTFTKKFPVSAIAVIEPVAFSVLDPVADANARSEDLDKVMALNAALKSGHPEVALGEFIGFWGQCQWSDLPSSMRDGLMNQVEQIGAEALSIACDDTSTDHYRELKMPVLLMQGSNTLSPAVAVVNRMADLIPHAQVTIVEGTGHMGAVQQPNQYAAPISRFLRRHIQ